MKRLKKWPKNTVPDSDLCESLKRAIEESDERSLKRILKEHGIYPAERRRNNALHWVSLFNRIYFLHLVHPHLDVNETNHQGMTAFGLALKKGNFHLAESLLVLKEVNPWMHRRKDSHPFVLALRAGLKHVVQIMLYHRKGREEFAKSPESKKIWEAVFDPNLKCYEREDLIKILAEDGFFNLGSEYKEKVKDFLLAEGKFDLYQQVH